VNDPTSEPGAPAPTASGAAIPTPAAPQAPPAAAAAGATAAAAGAPVPPPVPAAPVLSAVRLRALLPWLALLLALAALLWSWQLHQRLRAAQEEFARREQQALQQVVEARTLSREADETARDMAARIALLDARVSESALQRSQLEELMQSMSRSRDENVLFDIEAALRVAQQQSLLTGSVEPLVAALRQTEERLGRARQPRLERVRRAALEDLDRVRAGGTVDLTTLVLRLDEVTRQVDDLPMVSAHGPTAHRERIAAAPLRAASAPASAPASAASGAPRATEAQPTWLQAVQGLLGIVWAEARQLVRVTRIAYPEAALLAPEQALYLRENLRLRLLNARLSLLSRQFDSAQADLRQAQVLLDRYFDRESRRVVAASELLKQVTAQSRAVVVPRPDSTLAAIAAVTGGR
jgi:uroporphyrin-3 C-methyltransferase